MKSAKIYDARKLESEKCFITVFRKYRLVFTQKSYRTLIFSRFQRLQNGFTIAKFIPIYESDHMHDPTNDIPVFLLPTLFKVLEKESYHQFSSFSENKQVLFENETE